jgi:hypothetical protein
MAQDDDQRLQHILKETEARRKAAATQREFERQHLEAEARQRETAKSKIESLVGLFKSTAALVNGEIGSTGLVIEVEAERAERTNEIFVRVRAKHTAPGQRSEMIEMVITDKGYVRGADFFTGHKDRNATVDEFDAEMIRSGYLKLTERTLSIRPYR